MQSLKNFEVSKKQMESTTGGLYYGWGITLWQIDEGTGSGDVGTYVDGMREGTDAYEDHN